jgi:hypothetical protein
VILIDLGNNENSNHACLFFAFFYLKLWDAGNDNDDYDGF